MPTAISLPDAAFGRPLHFFHAFEHIFVLVIDGHDFAVVMFGQFSLASLFVDPAQQIMSRLECIRAILSI